MPVTASYFPLPLQISGTSWQQLELGERLRLAPESLHYRLQLVAGQLRQTGSPQASGAQLWLCGLLNDALRHIATRVLAAQPLQLPLPLLESFVDLFPPAEVHAGLPPRQYLSDRADRGRLALSELFLLAVQNRNHAIGPAQRLCDDSELQRRSRYREQLQQLDHQLGEGLAAFKRPPGSLLELLAEPLQHAPDSLEQQLDFVRRNWSAWLPAAWLETLPTALALAAAEFLRPSGIHGPSPGAGIGPAGESGWPEPEAFSQDADWMAEVVMIAKSTHVWLYQLSNRYGREITRLDQIPGEELDQLASAGINTLWLIGLWERSSASSRLKQLRGNPEAAASAYALYDYILAYDLGGEQAFQALRDQCYRRGIRLAGDVVPNHTGLYSRWIKEHPEWYLQLEYPPYPDYHFSSPDLSPDPELCLQIEDGYYTNTNAAVVFRHLDKRSGQQRFIYHGNDGTHMPWNDTAQLNYLLPEVREAMISTIVAVAKRFPVIRFDAAMTLAKKHFQRLWFPSPGAAGIPSRAEHSLSRDDFDAHFPVEFWREVVDRVAAEAPDTLLIAEAFWLMESYFVRSLGMHRVYNSAFMNMLKREENAKYRTILADTLAFNPEILKRFVNFMNNPDEATAVAQFGKGDKYFGVAVLLATLPGLPMFGHGQLEGLTEKYGMEYRRAYRDEAIDQGFLEYHRSQIFPLLQRRRLFSGAGLFELFDFETAGGVDDNVYAFVNGLGSERALVVFHNSGGDSHGRIRQAVAKCTAGEGSPTRRASLAEALGVEHGERLYRFREQHSGLWYLRSGAELTRGLPLELAGYDYRVFLHWAPIDDPGGLWRQLWSELQGQGIADPDREIRQRSALPLAELFLRLVKRLPACSNELVLETELERLYDLLQSLCGLPAHPQIAVERALTALKAWSRLPKTPEPAATSLPAAWLLLAAATVPPGTPEALDQLAWHCGELGLAQALAAASGKPAAGPLLQLALRYTGRLVRDPAPAVSQLTDDDQRRQLVAESPKDAEGLDELLVTTGSLLWCWIGHSAAERQRRIAELGGLLARLVEAAPETTPAEPDPIP